MTPDQAKVLSKSHPVPAQGKLDNRLRNLQRMVEFYMKKAPEGDDGGITFYAFAGSLKYAISIIKMYVTLTKKIAELAEQEETKP